jgi:predicted ATPase
MFAQCLAAASAGEPRVLLYEGEQGSGKSSLLDEIAASPLLPRRRIRVSFLALAEGDALDAVAQAARAVTRIGLYDRLGGRRRTLGMLSRLAPEWIGAIPGWGDFLEAIVRTSEIIRRRRRRAMPREMVAEEVAQILRVARRKPVALLFDNLELADEMAVERLRGLIRNAGVGMRLLIVGAFRTPPPGAPRAAIRLLVDRLPPQSIVHHRLGPLGAEDIDEWLAHRLDGGAPHDLRAWLVEETGGQPGAIEDTINALLERGDLRAQDGAWAFSPAARARDSAGPQLDLSRLGDAAADTVRAASVLGDRFAGDELARLLGLDELDVEDQLAIAVRFGLLEVTGTLDRPNGELATGYRFMSAAARAALHRALAPATRAALEADLDARGNLPDSFDGRNEPVDVQVPRAPHGP